MKKQHSGITSANAGVVSFAPVGRICLGILFLFCAVGCILYMTILSRTVSLTRECHFIPFGRWLAWLSGNGTIGREIVENIALFVPFGYMAMSLFSMLNVRKSGVLTVLLAMLFSIGIELLQYYSGRGTAEIDDVLNNTLGAVIGILLYRLAAVFLDKQKNAGKIVLSGILPALLVAACLYGCFSIAGRVGMTNLRTDQFWFSIDEVNGEEFKGRCSFYDHPETEYQIFLVDGTKKMEADLTCNGENFIAKAAQTDRKVEVKVHFKGYPMMPTGVFLNGGKAEYVAGTISAPPAPRPGAVLKACSEEHGCYVYQDGEELLWLISPDISLNTELVCHLQATKREFLPEKRRVHGFDNIGFRPSENDPMQGEYRLCVCTLPTTYPIASVIVGLNPGGKVIWQSSFRP